VTSIGLAAGNHQLEAVSHALCEVVERDALALWDERGAATGRHAGSISTPSTIPFVGGSLMTTSGPGSESPSVT
jgi:ribosomal protein S12 methylthiotransferase accessory factor